MPVYKSVTISKFDYDKELEELIVLLNDGWFIYNHFSTEDDILIVLVRDSV